MRPGTPAVTRVAWEELIGMASLSRRGAGKADRLWSPSLD